MRRDESNDPSATNIEDKMLLIFHLEGPANNMAAKSWLQNLVSEQHLLEENLVLYISAYGIMRIIRVQDLRSLEYKPH
ncbi:hypothetical protein AB3S75_044169 [Citrus x aurantiifolia]